MTLFLCSVVSIVAQTKRAVVIGIGNYPEASGWLNINGDKDVPIISDMLMINGFEKQNIETLQNQNATYENISNAIKGLIAEANVNDTIYIHFSGHGQQITDLNGDEADGFDEAWIPYDAPKVYSEGFYEGQRHIIDDTINSWLTQIRQKIGAKGQILVISDACHSGDGSRGLNDNMDSDVVYRGTSEKFIIPCSNVETVPPYKIDWIYISACKSYQRNFEYKTEDGYRCGSLSYILYYNRMNFNSSSYKQIFDVIMKCFHDNIKYPQTPNLEGDNRFYNDKFF